MADPTSSAPTMDASISHGGVVNVLSWFLAVTNVLAVLSRLGTKWVIQHKLGLDDGLITIALIFSLCQMAVVNVQVANGLGDHLESLDSDTRMIFQKAYYAGNILLLVSMCLAKFAVIFLIQLVTPVGGHRIINFIIAGSILVWGVTSVFVSAFSCHLPRPWEFIHGTCINESDFWTYVYTLNAVTDAALVILPSVIVFGLQVKLAQRINTVMIFAFRVVVIVASVAQIVILRQKMGSQDPTFDFWLPAVMAEVIQSLSIVATCLPYLKPFFESLQSGMIRSDDVHRTTGGTYGSGGSNQYASKRPNGRGWKKVVPNSIRTGTPHELSELSGADKGGNLTSIIAESLGTKDKREIDLNSQTSRSRIITQTVAWTVSSDRQDEEKKRQVRKGGVMN